MKSKQQQQRQQKNQQGREEKPAGNFWALRYGDKTQVLVVVEAVSFAVVFAAAAEIAIAAVVETLQEIASPSNWVFLERSG